MLLVLLFYQFNMFGVLMRTCVWYFWAIGDLLDVCAPENNGEHWFSCL